MGRLGGCVNTGSARSRLVSWVVGVSVISMLFATGATACVASPAPAPPQPPDCTDPVCPLAAAARSRGIRVGAAVVGRYQGRVDRWDVVNELFEYPVGVQAPSAFDRLGPDYVAELFEVAHAADPGAELWLNEVFTEVFPAKGDALVALVSSLRDRGVPIHGVGLQTHLTLSPAAPNPGSVSGLVARLRALGVEVAITELDVPLGPLRTELSRWTSTGRSPPSACRPVARRSPCGESGMPSPHWTRRVNGRTTRSWRRSSRSRPPRCSSM